LNCTFSPIVTLLEAGETVTELIVPVAVAVATVTVELPDLVESATLVAVTVSVPALAGAVYLPVGVMIPSEAFHVTLLLVAVPWTVPANDRVPPGIDFAGEGDTVTDVTSEPAC
jgi:hypothetical protein